MILQASLLIAGCVPYKRQTRQKIALTRARDGQASRVLNVALCLRAGSHHLRHYYHVIATIAIVISSYQNELLSRSYRPYQPVGFNYNRIT